MSENDFEFSYQKMWKISTNGRKQKKTSEDSDFRLLHHVFCSQIFYNRIGNTVMGIAAAKRYSAS